MSDTFEVKQGVDPNYLRNTLTKDITALEAIFDLVDNSVDGAREQILSARNPALDQYGLPSGYSGFNIDIYVGKNKIEVIDNCIGLSERKLSNNAFVTGLVSEHRFGIGGFGIGMKRALFRLGSKYQLHTDTGQTAAQMHFNKAQLSDTSKPLIASRVATSKKTKTSILISDLDHGVRHEFSTKSGVATLIKNLSRRYGLYLKKGMRIRVGGKKIPHFGPEIRQSGPVKNQSRHHSTSNGVQIFIDSGMHELYRVTNEKDYVDNAELTDQYGWYFVCNDRIVKIASHEKELGWTTNWHQEYYGFIGWVRFVAEGPAHLPWDTKKTLIDPNSSAFRAISSDLQELADQYRTQNKRARKGKSASPQPSAHSSGQSQSVQEEKASNTVANGRPTQKKRDPKDHNENWNTLLPELTVRPSHPKLRALVYEATGLALSNPYAGSMLFRVIVEFALIENLRRARKYQAVRESYFEEQQKRGRKLTDEQKKEFRPSLAQAVEWLGKNESYFPEEVRRECSSSRSNFSKYLKELNRIVHEGDLTNSEKLKVVRDDTLPLLQFLLKGS